MGEAHGYACERIEEHQGVVRRDHRAGCASNVEEGAGSGRHGGRIRTRKTEAVTEQAVVLGVGVG